MKLKIIAASITLLTLGSVGNVLAGQGENSLQFTVKADVAQATGDDNVQIRVYNQNNALPNANITANLKESVDDLGNLVWGSTGQYLYFEGWPQIAPKDIYVVEVYSKAGAITYSNLLETKCTDLSLVNGADSKNILTGNCAHMLVNDSKAPLYLGAAGAIPDALKQEISSPQYFEASKEDYYDVPSSIKEGDALYFPISFFAHMPAWGDDLSSYPEGRYTVTSSMIIRASWQ